MPTARFARGRPRNSSSAAGWCSFAAATLGTCLAALGCHAGDIRGGAVDSGVADAFVRIADSGPNGADSNPNGADSGGAPDAAPPPLAVGLITFN